MNHNLPVDPLIICNNLIMTFSHYRDSDGEEIPMSENQKLVLERALEYTQDRLKVERHVMTESYPELFNHEEE